MPRIRSIKPELVDDEKLASISRDARYTFVLLIALADNYGYILAPTRSIASKLYPHDEDIDLPTVAGWLSELSGIGALHIKETRDGTPVIALANWKKHQKLDKRGKDVIGEKLGDRTLPAFPLRSASVPPASPVGSASVPAPSLDGSDAVTPRSRDLGIKGTRDQGILADADIRSASVPGPDWRPPFIAAARKVPLGMQPPRYLKILKDLVLRDGPEKVLGHWEIFLEVGRRYHDGSDDVLAVPRPISCLTPERFRDTYDEWAPAAGPRLAVRA